MLIKKVKLPLLGIIIAVILACSYYYADERITREASLGSFNYRVYDNAQDLHNNSEFIILAAATKDSTEHVSEGEYMDGYTVTNVEIIKDERKSDSAEDVVAIIEPTFSVDNGFISLGRTQFYSEDYRKAVPGAWYLLFLNWDEHKHAYWVHALHQGKINVDGKDMREAEVVLHNETFKKLKDDVMKHYDTEDLRHGR